MDKDTNTGADLEGKKGCNRASWSTAIVMTIASRSLQQFLRRARIGMQRLPSHNSDRCSTERSHYRPQTSSPCRLEGSSMPELAISVSGNQLSCSTHLRLMDLHHVHRRPISFNAQGSDIALHDACSAGSQTHGKRNGCFVRIPNPDLLRSSTLIPADSTPNFAAHSALPFVCPIRTARYHHPPCQPTTFHSHYHPHCITASLQPTSY